ncbi:hypothetical protein [Halopseudomonas salegens]|uniref:hypothetical protein n=1 Tax=Halopseudomonas salegens TaxID=1434072 RepID=UPI0012FD84E4|nr:hypothetical protein [Halopseudomonas salegens]
MITNTLKSLLAAICLGMFFYTGSVFGFSLGHFLLPILALAIIISIVYKPLALPINHLCKGVGILSLLSFLLLMLAGTMGGSFHLSPSNQVIATLLAGIALFGLTSFFWSEKIMPAHNK